MTFFNPKGAKHKDYETPKFTFCFLFLDVNWFFEIILIFLINFRTYYKGKKNKRELWFLGIHLFCFAFVFVVYKLKEFKENTKEFNFSFQIPSHSNEKKKSACVVQQRRWRVNWSQAKMASLIHKVLLAFCFFLDVLGGVCSAQHRLILSCL